MDQDTQHQIEEAVRRAFSAEVGQGRYVDVSRVPLICQSIIGINEKLETLVTQDQFWPVKTLVYGFVGLTLTAIVATLLMVVIN